MAFYTATYSQYCWPPNCQQKIFEDGDFTAWQTQGRYFLYYKDYQLAQCINGQESLDKAHKGSFTQWIENVKKKDLKKIEKLEEYKVQLEEDIELIKSIWK